MDTFNTLSQRMLNRCPDAGVILCQQFVNDAWHSLQAKREWSWRRRSGTFAPPALYTIGTVSTNVGSGLPTIITGVGTAWTSAMVGSQIRAGGLMYPYYTITGVISPTSLQIDVPWAGPDVSGVSYNILQCYYPAPADFGYFYMVVSIKDGYRLWLNMTESDLAFLDPQRTNQGQTYAVSFRDYTATYGGNISPVIPVGASGAIPISTTSVGFTYVANSSYIIQVISSGISGVATFKWMRVGQPAFSSAVTTSTTPVDLMDGVQIYWPSGVTYTSGDLFIINATSSITSGVPRFELWPAPTYPQYLYPYQYIAKESDVNVNNPTFPPFVANRGEVLLEMSLLQCAMYPGTTDKPNKYFNLDLAKVHAGRAETMIAELERNDEEVGLSNIFYQEYPFYPAPWLDAGWQQQHAPFL